MPQVWATYSEIAEGTGEHADAVRRRLHDVGAPRRRCSDGQTRVKLTWDQAVRLLARHPDVKTSVYDLAGTHSVGLPERLEEIERRLREELSLAALGERPEVEAETARRCAAA